MKNYVVLIVAIFTLLACGDQKKKNDPTKTNSPEVKPTLTLISETKDLPRLESVILDKKRDVLYVSLQNEKAPGDGSIVILSLDGNLLNSRFILGLNEPKGMTIVGDFLYVADLLELLEINLETGEITNRYTDKKARYFNDVTSDVNGNVYVTDMHASSIYKLDASKEFSVWFDSPELESANGLLAEGNELIIGGWGYFTDGKALLAPKGRLLKMNINTKELTRITDGPIGNIDGIQAYNASSYFVSDWKEGKVFLVGKNGETKELLDTKQGSADLWFIQDKNLLLLPLNKEHKLAFYKVH